MEEKFAELIRISYKVLDFLPESEPLKNKAKEKVLEIMEYLEKNAAVSQLKDNINVFLSLLEFARKERWIDDLNFLILKKEYEAIKKEIPAGDAVLNRALSLRGPALSGDEAISTVKIATPSSADSARNDGEKLQKELTERQEKILGLLKEREKVQVSDIIKVLPNVTKRTIRRDLDGLLEMGKVVRIGEWNQVFYKVFDGTMDRTVILS